MTNVLEALAQKSRPAKAPEPNHSWTELVLDIGRNENTIGVKQAEAVLVYHERTHEDLASAVDRYQSRIKMLREIDECEESRRKARRIEHQIKAVQDEIKQLRKEASEKISALDREQQELNREGARGDDLRRKLEEYFGGSELAKLDQRQRALSKPHDKASEWLASRQSNMKAAERSLEKGQNSSTWVSEARKELAAAEERDEKINQELREISQKRRELIDSLYEA